jgi:hypothetical protein
MGDVVDAEFTEEKSDEHARRLDAEWSERASNVISLFADEPKPEATIYDEAFKKFGYGKNLVHHCLVWLEERKMAESKLRGGVRQWGKPVDVRKLVDAAAGVAEVMAHPVEAMGGEKAARVMREAAATARAVPAAVEGIKKEAKPALDAFSRLANAAREAGILRVREPLEVDLARKKEK